MSRWKYLNLVKFLVPTSLVIGGFGFTGCATGPLFENPAVVRPELETTSENPVYVPLGQLLMASFLKNVWMLLTTFLKSLIRIVTMAELKLSPV